MLTINDNILGKDFTGEILVNGINVWNQDAMQFSLYTLVDASENVKKMLGIEEKVVKSEAPHYPSSCADPFNSFPESIPTFSVESNAKDFLLVFPFQCGIKYAPGYHLLNVRDCIGVTTLEELQAAWKGER